MRVNTQHAGHDYNMLFRLCMSLRWGVRQFLWQSTRGPVLLMAASDFHIKVKIMAAFQFEILFL